MRMKLAAIFFGLMTLPLAGCGQWERTKANYTGWSEVCVDGVAYLQFPSGVSPKFIGKEGGYKLAECQ